MLVLIAHYASRRCLTVGAAPRHTREILTRQMMDVSDLCFSARMIWLLLSEGNGGPVVPRTGFLSVGLLAFDVPLAHKGCTPAVRF